MSIEKCQGKITTENLLMINKQEIHIVNLQRKNLDTYEQYYVEKSK